MNGKYRVSGPFGLKNIGDVTDVKILTIDDDTGIALCYHPKNKDGCGSFSLVIKKKGYWVNAFKNEKIYVNLGSRENTDKKFRKFLNTF